MISPNFPQCEYCGETMKEEFAAMADLDLDCDENFDTAFESLSKNHKCDINVLKKRIDKLREEKRTSENKYEQVRLNIVKIFQKYNVDLHAKSDEVQMKTEFIRDLAYACEEFLEGEELDYKVDSYNFLFSIAFDAAHLFLSYLNKERCEEQLENLREEVMKYYLHEKFIDEKGFVLGTDKVARDYYHISTEELLKKLRND